MNPSVETSSESSAQPVESGKSCGTNCGCSEPKQSAPAPVWEGLTAASGLPQITERIDSEPEEPQGEYNPQAPEAPFQALIDRAAPLAGHAAQVAELLAPAGGLDSGFAAFHYGADAIYLGLMKFSARAEAENFSLEEVDEITTYAHSLTPRRRVFVTINTLILQHELEEMIEALGALEEIGVDALIIQDLGTYRLVKQYFPKLELHASTQLAVHNRAGAESLKNMGFTRVVLARELTFEEVRDITNTSGVETEVFVHGALCYSYSGLCLFSAQTLGRSGNRGKCAYTCRDNYTITGAPDTLRDGTSVKRDPDHGFPFSMKDLALPDHLPALRAAGVSCFKIEGRKKSPLYVATTTDYYRKLLDGELTDQNRPQIESAMQTVFSRPWTRLFIQSHKDKEVADRDTVGHRGTRVGVVEGTKKDRFKSWLRFTSTRALELHDGIQIDVPGLDRPFGFAVNELRIASKEPPASNRKHYTPDRDSGKTTFETPANTTVEVLLPDEHPILPEGAPVYCASSQDVKRAYRHERPKPGLHRGRRGVRIEADLSSDELKIRATVPASITGEKPVDLNATLPGPFEPAKDATKTAAAAQQSFEKLGETGLALEKLTWRNPQGLFVPVSQLNEFRRVVSRQVEAALSAAHQVRLEQVKKEVLEPLVKVAKSTVTDLRQRDWTKLFGWSIKVDRIAFLDSFTAEDWAGVDEAVVDISRDQPTILGEKLEKLSAGIGRNKIRLALPAVTRKWEETALIRKLDQLQAAGWKNWELANVSGWDLMKVQPNSEAVATSGLRFAADWSLYVINRMAAQQLQAMGVERFCLSPEDGLANMGTIAREFGSNAVAIVHQDTPLFIAESCAYANLIGGCPGKANCRFESMEMVSSHGEKVTALDYHCRTIVLNKGAFCLAPRLKDLYLAGVKSLRAEFIYRTYEPDEVRAAWRVIRTGRNVPRGHAANFDKGLL